MVKVIHSPIVFWTRFSLSCSKQKSDEKKEFLSKYDSDEKTILSQVSLKLCKKQKIWKVCVYNFQKLATVGERTEILLLKNH